MKLVCEEEMKIPDNIRESPFFLIGKSAKEINKLRGADE